MPDDDSDREGIENWRSLLEPEVREFFRDHPREPDAEFEQWVRDTEVKLARQAPSRARARVAVDGLHVAIAECVEARVWERWSRQVG